MENANVEGPDGQGTDALWPLEKKLTLLREEPPIPTPECPNLQTLRALAKKNVREAAAVRLMSHIAGCAYCREQYITVLRAQRLAAAARQEATGERASDLPLSRVPAWHSDIRPLLSRALVPAMVVALLLMPLAGLWLVKQNNELRTQQAPLTRNDGGKPTGGSAFLLPNQATLALLNANNSPVRPMSGSDTTSSDIALIYPPARALLQEKTPRFQWKAVPNAASYVITVADVSRPDISVSPGPKIKPTFWQMTLPLASGDVYDWGVEAYDSSGKVIAQSRFTRFLVMAPQ